MLLAIRLSRIGNLKIRRSLLICAVSLTILMGLASARQLPRIDPIIGLVFIPLAIFSWRRQNFLTLICLVVLAFLLGASRGNVLQEQLSPYQTLALQKVTITGIATDDGVYDKRYQMAFTMSHLQITRPTRDSIPGNIGVSGYGVPAIYRGDKVEVVGKLYPTRGNNQASINFAELKVISHDTSWLESVRHRFISGMLSALPEPLASFGLGLLIGQRNTLPSANSQQLMMVGLTHIIAVSGYNLTILVEAARRLLGKRSKFQSTVTCLGLISLFVLLTGNSPSIIRASIVSLLSIAAWYYGRTVKPMVLILVAAALTGLANPLYVWGNVSWYLSFLAFFGVLVWAPQITKRFWRNREPNLLMMVLIESFCASLMTMPYILLIFGQTSLVALPANLLVVPFIPLAMALSLVAGLAGMFAPAFAGWLAWPAHILLSYMLDIAALLSQIPHAFVDHLQFSFSALLITYGCVLFICIVLWSKNRQNAMITDKGVQQARGE